MKDGKRSSAKGDFAIDLTALKRLVKKLAIQLTSKGPLMEFKGK